jgi:large subunit ribosomal protein L33
VWGFLSQGVGRDRRLVDTPPYLTPQPGDNTMAKGKKKLEVIHLVCEETGDHNYTLRRKTGGEKLKVKKYSPRLRKHTVHNEKKK